VNTQTEQEKQNELIGPGEHADDLQYKGLVLIQKENTFRFGTDAVLLTNFAAEAVINSGKYRKRLYPAGKAAERDAKPVNFLDIGCGSGIIPVLLCGKVGASPERAKFTGVEAQEEMCELARRSVKLNGQEGSIEILCADIRESGLRRGSFDIITLNPPYVRAGCGLKNEISGIASARHEILGTQEELMRAAASLLTVGGKLFIVNRPDRLADTLLVLREAGAEPGRLCFVQPDAKAAPVLFLCEATRGSGVGLKVLPPVDLTVYTPPVFD